VAAKFVSAASLFFKYISRR